MANYYCQINTGLIITSNKPFVFENLSAESNVFWLQKSAEQYFIINGDMIDHIDLKYEHVSIRYESRIVTTY